MLETDLRRLIFQMICFSQDQSAPRLSVVSLMLRYALWIWGCLRVQMPGRPLLLDLKSPNLSGRPPIRLNLYGNGKLLAGA